MKYRKLERGRDSVERTLWAGEPHDGGAYLRLHTWWGQTFARCELSVGDDESELSLSLGLFWFTVVLSLHLPVFRRWLPYERRDLGWYLYWEPSCEAVSAAWWDAGLSVSIWNDDMDWRSDQLTRWPWQGTGWSFYLRPWRWIPGDTRYEKDEEATRTHEVLVELPEGSYPAVVTTERVRWQRPRWFVAPWMFRSTVEVPGGVPIPGKGENAWDCDDDAIYSSTGSADLVQVQPEQAAERLADSVRQRRQRYASDRWVPREGWPSHIVPASVEVSP